MENRKLKPETPLVPVSWGELFDKISMLKIKSERLSSAEALENVNREYSLLNALFPESVLVQTDVKKLSNQLKIINEQLWDIEDQIRAKERDNSFDDEFIALARNVYLTNDERSLVKRSINEILGSELKEEKSYSKYIAE